MSSNPYDLTSGVLGLAQIRNEQKRLGLMQPYYEAEAGKAKEMTRGLEISNNMKSMKASWIRGLLDKKKGGVNTPPVDLSGVSNGEYTLGVKKPDEFKPDYTLTGSQNNLSSQDQEIASEFEDAEGHADGTLGGLKVPAPAQQQTQQQVQPAGSHPNSIDAKGSSAFSTLQENDPVKAENLASNVFGASPKEFQKMIGDFALIDWADDKITSKGLMDQVNAVKKMQAEGLGAAMQYALAGNYEKAIAKFDESGDVRGESIAKIEKYQIKNPVPGAVKGTKDSYDGVKITHKDGTVDFLDPRRLLAETVSLKEVVDNDYRFGHSIRSTDADVYRTDAMQQSNKLKSDELALMRQQSDQLKSQQRLSQEFKSIEDNEMETLLKGSRRSDLLTKPAEFEAAKASIDRSLQGARTLAAINIELGNIHIDSGRARKYSQFMVVNGADDPNAQFWRDPSNFKTGPNGAPLVANMGGRMVYQTVDGVYLPSPVIRQPQQSAPPAPAASAAGAASQ